MDITNKIVVVTGASSGIGAEIAKAMGNAGASHLVLIARNSEQLAKLASEIQAAGHHAIFYLADLSQAPDVTKVAQRVLSEVGVPDILVNNAGQGQWKFLEDSSPDEIQQMMAVPYFAAAWLTREFLPGMVSRGSGHIVNISSVASRFVWPGATGYTAARWAIRGFSEALRADLYGTGVKVTLYESGEVESPYWQHNAGSRERIPKIGTLMIPVLTPEQVGQAVVAGVRKNKRLIVIPFMMKLIYLQHFFFPWVVQWLMTITGYLRRS